MAPARKPKRILVQYRRAVSEETIEFTRKPEVLVDTFPRRTIPEVFERKQSDGSVLRCEISNQGPEVIWLFFSGRHLAAVVKLDGLPERFESKQTCRKVWPTKVVFLPTEWVHEGPSLRVEMCDGTAFDYSAWYPAVVPFNDSLWGTDLFWEPLDERRDEFTAAQVKQIKVIAAREYGGGLAEANAESTDRSEPGVLGIFDDYCRITFGNSRYNISRPLTRMAIKVLCAKHPSPVERRSWFNALYTALNRDCPAYATWKPLDWFTGNCDERPFYDDFVGHKGSLYHLKSNVQSVEIH